MRIRTITATRMDEALRLIRDELGPEALILSTKKIKQPNGTMGLEITVAVEEPESPTQSLTPPIASEGSHASAPKNVGNFGIRTSPAPQNFGSAPGNPASALENHNIPQHLINRLNTATQGLEPAGFSGIDALEMVLSKLVNFQSPTATYPAGKAHVFVGPVGAGKTTWVSKMAVQAKKQGRTVGLMSLDDQKIAGFEPLAVTANALGDTAYLIKNKEDLRKAASSMGPRNMLLIDTPGTSLYNKQAITHLLSRIQDLNLPTVIHLVIPGNLSGPEMGKLPVAFHHFNLASILFTRLDDMAHFGPLINVLVESNFPTSFASNGSDPTLPPLTLTARYMAEILTTQPRQPWEISA